MKEFKEIKGKLGFGCMRLPMNGEEVDYDHFNRMIDKYLAAGFNYFDTAHGYISGKSETAIRDCLVARYPRESFLLADKLSDPYFDSEEDIHRFFAMQLEATGTGYFDFYLMHSLADGVYENKYKRYNAFAIARQLKAEGKIRHIGMSFHDKADVLRKILSEQPDIEFVQVQFNYIDYDDPNVQSGAVYDVCREFGKPVIAMEPVKGGKLAVLPDEAAKVLAGLSGGTPASYAMRYAAGFDEMMLVLSGMSTTGQMDDNISFMKAPAPLSPEEADAVETVRGILRAQDLIPCTACRYCVDGCPKKIPIPALISCMNSKKQYNDPKSYEYYNGLTRNAGKASDCVRCRKCEAICPQHLPICSILTKIAGTFE